MSAEPLAGEVLSEVLCLVSAPCLPVAVDPVGIKTILEYAAKATQKGLCVVTGNQRRNQLRYLKALKLVREGAIGEIVGGQVYWNQSQLWYRFWPVGNPGHCSRYL